MNSVQGKNAIVTGGANGIGFQYCRQLLHNGAKTVAIFDLPNANGGKSTSKLNEEFGAGRAIFFESDVTKLDELEVVFKNAVKALGGLDILINNAGIMNDAIWQKEIAINCIGLIRSTLLGYDHMGKHKGGKGGIIINIASTAALVESPVSPIYSATKHAVVGFSVNLKGHFAKTGVSVRVLCPGVTDTHLISDAHQFLDIVDNVAAAKTVQGYPRQSCESVAKALIELIEKGDNGTIWVSQGDKPPFAIELAKYNIK